MYKRAALAVLLSMSPELIGYVNSGLQHNNQDLEDSHITFAQPGDSEECPFEYQQFLTIEATGKVLPALREEVYSENEWALLQLITEEGLSRVEEAFQEVKLNPRVLLTEDDTSILRIDVSRFLAELFLRSGLQDQSPDSGIMVGTIDGSNSIFFVPDSKVELKPLPELKGVQISEENPFVVSLDLAIDDDLLDILDGNTNSIYARLVDKSFTPGCEGREQINYFVNVSSYQGLDYSQMMVNVYRFTWESGEKGPSDLLNYEHGQVKGREELFEAFGIS